MTCRNAPPGSDEDKVIEEVRLIDPPLLQDDTSTAVGAATVTERTKTFEISIYEQLSLNSYH